MKDRRLYGKFTLDFPDSHKIMPLSDAAFRCLVEATLWSRKQMTDGLLPISYAHARWSLEVCQELLENDPVNPSFVRVENGYLIHDFADHQTTRADLERVREARKTAGRKGGLAKAAASGKQLAKQTASKTYPETETETYKNTSKFDAFWDAYPRKVGRKAAEKAYVKALSEITDDELIAAAKAYAIACKGSEPKFIAHPLTWLRQGRWDEYATTSTTPEQFLRNCWENATLAPIEELTGRKPECIRFPDPKPANFDKEQYLKGFRRSWIEDNRTELIEALEGRL